MTELGNLRRARPASPRSDSLADVLERVLDRGVVIAGDVVVSVLDVELLTLKVRLLIATVDTAREMGIDWWTRDAFLTEQGRRLHEENHELRNRLEALEQAVAAQPVPNESGDGSGSAKSALNGSGSARPAGKWS
jgi:Gas vesicle protein